MLYVYHRIPKLCPAFYPDIYAASWLVRLNDYHHSHTHTARNISFKGLKVTIFAFSVLFSCQIQSAGGNIFF